jgi:hypothetical protein
MQYTPGQGSLAIDSAIREEIKKISFLQEPTRKAGVPLPSVKIVATGLVSI